jgi:large subunit ribosomal protein L21
VQDGASRRPSNAGAGPAKLRSKEIQVFAIIQSGGRQIRVEPGAVVTVDRLEAAAGQEVAFDKVLLVAGDGGEVAAGAPFVAGARVVGVVTGETRGPKIRVFKKKRRKGFRRTKGHRSTATQVRITHIGI